MKKLALNLLLLSTLGLFVSCSKDVQTSDYEDSALRLSAEVSDYTALKFIQDKHLWAKEDKLTLYNIDYEGSRQAVASPINPGTSTSNFVFNIPLKNGENTIFAVYPQDAGYLINKSEVQFTIPQNQDGSIMNLQAGKAVCKKGSYESGRLLLKPLYKVINVKVGRGNRTVKSIKLSAKDGSLIAGEVKLDIRTWSYNVMSGSVTITPTKPLSCHESSISIPVMVADNNVSDYIAEVRTEEGETFVTEEIFEGYAPQDKTLELGVSQAIFGSLSQAEASSMIQAGVKYLEVTFNTFWRNQTEEECQQRFESTVKIINNTADLKVWSVHLPFSGTLDISVADEDERAANVELLTKIIRMAGEFKPQKLVLHPSSEPISDSERETRLQNSIESIGKLLPIAKEIGAQLCIENLPRTCLGRNSSEMKRLIEKYPEVGVCFDSNHLLIESHNSFFSTVGDRIGTIHASDYDMVDERHWVPGKGVIDWPAFLTGLMHYGYDGVFMTEVKSATVNEVVNSYRNVICKTN